MFTGLVQAVGQLGQSPEGVEVRIAPGAGLDPASLALGDSVAVDGVCLTVAALLPQGFRADVSGETLARTTLAAKAAHQGAVNLEPALRLADRLGGHLVSGHVDGLAEVVAIEPRGSSWHLGLRWQDSSYGRYICEKASVAVNGISLTVAGCEPNGALFWIAVIPHTWSHSTLAQLQLGDLVNLEADLLAKYTERLLRASRVDGAPVAPSPEPITVMDLPEQCVAPA
jgi:riboflavin synthase